MLFHEAPGVGAGKGVVEDGNENAEFPGRDIGADIGAPGEDCPLGVDCPWLAPNNAIPVDCGTSID